MPLNVSGTACRHGVPRLRAASPCSARDDRSVRRQWCRPGVGLVLLLIMSPSLGQTLSTAKQPPTSMLEGQVVKDPGGTPVKKAEVQLIAEAQEEESSNYIATTDAEGHFKIERIRPGRYRAFVERT